MRLSTLLPLAIFATSSLFGQDAQQIADNLTVKSPAADSKRIPMPRVRGAEVRLLGADYEQIIDSKGLISHPLSDTSVRVSFEVKKDGKSAISKDYEITVPGRGKKGGNPKPQIIPDLLSWSGGQGSLEIPAEVLVFG